MTPTRVLIVDDDHQVGEMFADALRERGYDVALVDDGAHALTEVARVRPDVIVLDLIMPKAELDGLAFLSRLPSTAAADVPVVVLSGLGDALAGELSADITGALRIAAILAKPTSIDTLTHHIEDLAVHRPAP